MVRDDSKGIRIMNGKAIASIAEGVQELTRYVATVLLIAGGVVLFGAMAIFSLAPQKPMVSVGTGSLNSPVDFACSNVTEIPQIECEALVALYNNTGGAGWTNYTAGWQPYTPCSWYGVSCTAGHIVQLDLFSNQLNGSIPAQLGNLAHLRNLYLDQNRLNGSIPSQLGTLTNLQLLDLSYNQLNGSIPLQLGNLANLQKLLLSDNQLSSSIPPELGNLMNLQELWLSNNQLSGSIPAELGNLINLLAFDLESNQLSGAIPSGLGNLINLKFVNLTSTI